METCIICLAVSLMIFVFSPAHAFTMTVETETDRPDNIPGLHCDYKNFSVPSYVVCMNECGIDPSCQAWNYDPVHVPSTPMCFLKNCFLGPVSSPGLTSGIKAPFNMGAFEYNVDRGGKDYKNFTTSNEVTCSNACGFDSMCQAWNYDHRQGSPGMCYLKSSVPSAKVNVNTVGGVKLHSPAD